LSYRWLNPLVIARGIKRRLPRRDPDRFLRRLEGVIHVGANSGQERDLYARLGLKVLWIEPIPEVFEMLEQNIRMYPSQRALRALVADNDDTTIELRVANNQGASSSIFDLDLHRDIWPEVKYDRTLVMQTATLPTLLQQNGVDAARYDGLILDTQGSELLILRGAAPLLPGFRFIKTEVADFSSYAGGCQLSELDNFLASHGFVQHRKHKFAEHPSGGAYYDVVYRRRV
jgi:FkbM family methyltransferase